MSEKILAFARKRADEALACFRGERAYSEGMPKARAALDLLERAKSCDLAIIGPLCKGMVEVLAVQGLFCEAFELLATQSLAIADDHLQGQLLEHWRAAVNRPAKGDLVQIASVAHGIQPFVGVAVAPITEGCDENTEIVPTRWRVRLCNAGATGDPEALATAPVDDNSAELEVDTSAVTLLRLRLTEEQRERWLQLLQICPELFGDRIRPENEARWQKLFGGCATRLGGVVGAGAAGGSADLGLPLEQSFVASLHCILLDYLKLRSNADGQTVADHDVDLVVDILGCEPALELEDSKVQLAALFASTSIARTVRNLTVRMCGPEVGCEAWDHKQQDESRCLTIVLRPGLYHDAFPESGAGIVIAFHAGISAPQYSRLWAPTLQQLKKQPRRTLLAITTHSPGEFQREVRLLRRRFARRLQLKDVTQLRALVSRLSGPAPWTIQDSIEIQGVAPCGSASARSLERGDVVEPEQMELRKPRTFHSASQDERAESSIPQDVLRAAGAALLQGPWCFKVLRAKDVVYIGPNPYPGRSRNYGKLLMWVGGEDAVGIGLGLDGKDG